MNSGTDEEDDLQLRIRRQSIPLVRRATGGSNIIERDLAGELPREMELNGEGGAAMAEISLGHASENVNAG